MKKILYCGFGLANNIGNAFVDYGLLYQLQKSAIDYEVYGVSNTTSFQKQKVNTGIPYKWFPKYRSELIDARTLYDPDYVVFGGSLLDPYWFKFNEAYIKYLIKEKIKVIVLGGSGGNIYNGKNYAYVSNILSSINLYALISRDQPTFDKYHNLALHSYNGIDNAFFLKDAYKPAKLNISNIGLLVFDFHREPQINLKDGLKYFKFHNSLTSMIGYEGILTYPFKQKKWVNESIVVSDTPSDYLNLFGNSKCTYSDRVHACVATLIYGGYAQYFDNSSRSYLFERVNIDGIKYDPVCLDLTFIESEKKNQIDFLKTIF